MLSDIKIDKEFSSLIPPLSEEERHLLEQSIIDHGGARDPLVVWSGEPATLIDGHNRFEICDRLGLPYNVHEMQFDSREDVCDWIDANQLGRRNLTPDSFRLLLGRRYNRMKKAQGARGKQKTGHFDPSSGHATADSLAAEHGVTEKTVRRAGKFAEEVEQTPELQQAIIDQVPVAKAKKVMAKKHRRAENLRIAQEVEKSTGVKASERCQLGDVWQLGDHILYCGDTSQTPFRSLVGSSASLAFADPPYGADKDGFNDSRFYWEHDYLSGIADLTVVTPGIVSIFEFAKLTTMPYRWSLSTWISNGMTRGAIGFGNWIYSAVFSRKGVFRQAQDFLKITISNEETPDTDHPTRKPASYIRWIIETFSEEGDTVIDPFLGSGQTLVVSEAMGRKCIGGELSPKFCSSIIARWEAMTGRKASKV